MKTDNFGLVTKSSIKIYSGTGHTWGMKLSQLARQRTARILTYSLPRPDYLKTLFGRRPHGVLIVCNSKFKKQAEVLSDAFPFIEVRVHPELHSKVCLIEPQTVILGSANLGNSKWHESMAMIKSKAAHDWMLENGFYPAWDSAQVVGDDVLF